MFIPEKEVPSNEESIAKALAEIDLEEIRFNYLAYDFLGLKNRFRCLFKPRLLKEKQKRLLQLDFLTDVKKLTASLEIKSRAYILLGAFQYAMGRWLPFPSHGPLFELELKRGDLVQIISENDSNIKLEILFNNPNLINIEADKAFLFFLEKNPEMHKKYGT